MSRHVAIDIDTAHSSDHAISIAAVEIENGVVGGCFARLVRPKVSIQPHYADLHGVRDSDLADSPSLDDILPDFLEFISDSILVAHGAESEWAILKNEFERRQLPVIARDRFLCTMEMADRRGLPDKLREACQAVGVSIEEYHERTDSLSDAELCADLFVALTVGAEPRKSEVDYVVAIRSHVIPKVNAAFQQNRYSVIPSLMIANEGADDLEGIIVEVETNPPFLRKTVVTCDRMKAGTTLDIPTKGMQIDSDYLRSLQEAVPASLTISVRKGEVLLAREDVETRMLALDEWTGSGVVPELLAAFVRPNDPAIDIVLRSASKRLEEAGHSSAIDGYKGGKVRAWQISEAIYLAISDLDVTYALPPSSFEREGQRVRSPSAIVSGRLGTCLDTALLYAACLEQAGLNPLVILSKGHACTGVWLTSTTFPDAVMDEAAAVRRRISTEDLVVVETTLLTQRGTFAAAVATAKGLNVADDEFEMVLDVRKARHDGVRPLAFGGTVSLDVVAEEGAAPGKVAFGATPTFMETIHLDAGKASDDRLSKWKRKLLDLSFRNKLINLVDGKSTLPVGLQDCEALEDVLSSGETLKIAPAPVDLPGKETTDVERITRLRLALQDGTVHVGVVDKEFDRRLMEVVRTARTNIEEGGANTLFMAFGLLRWIPAGNKMGKAYEAPLLLVPVKIERRTGRATATLSLVNEERRFNPALLELLKQEFGILELSDLAGTLPADQSGTDLKQVLHRVAEAVKDMPGWEVLHRSVISNFSFTKFLMWKDLEDRSEALRASAIVENLLNGTKMPASFSGVGQGPIVLDNLDPGETFMPLTADSSQAEAVAAAARGESFVLNGPPGTGKSQTIANIVSHSLVGGKSVLFVSQKTAALEVVSRRLRDVGLGPYCLEVHSHKAQRHEVVKSLARTWAEEGEADEGEWTTITTELRHARNELNALARALHRPRSGSSAYVAIARSVKARRGGTTFELGFDDLPDDHSEELATRRKACEELQVTMQPFPVPTDHPLANVRTTEWTPAWRNAFLAAINEGQKATTGLALEASALARRVSLPVPETLADAVALMTLVELANDVDFEPGRAFLEFGQQLVAAVKEARDMSKAVHGLEGAFKAKYAPSVWKLDAKALSAEWQEASKRSFLTRGRAMRKVREELAAHAKGALPENLGEELRKLESAASARRKLAKANAALPHGFVVGGHVDMGVAQAGLDWCKKARRALADLTGLEEERTDIFLVEETRQALVGLGLAEANRVYGVAMSTIVDLCANPHPFGEGRPSAAEVCAILEGWSRHRNQWQAWCQWRKAAALAEGLGLGPLVKAVGEARISIQGILRSFDDSYFVWFADRCIGEDALLSGFVAARQDAMVQRFRELDDRVLDLSRKVARSRLAARIPLRNETQGVAEWDLLDKQSKLQRPSIPIRQMFEKMPTALGKLAPCMMMSPLSVAQYLPVDAKFDLVIFDEASQVTPWDAVGALARARQAIVVGDAKQMPPTESMFDGDDGGGDELVDMESVLDACNVSGMGSRDLKWHYRSRSESLIAFSKEHYYRSMLTFPSALTEDRAVKVEFVKEGRYDKGSRTNRAEAEALVKDVVRRLSDPDFVARGASLGIVTFNGNQMALVEELLLEARRSRPDLDAFFQTSRPDYVFVKNLENVQGDERDVILFSVTFAPDGTGKPVSVVSNLNRPGGERRLNVAVTRSRREMVLFSSMRSSDISVGSSMGIEHFRNFLEYAEMGPIALATHTSAGDKADSILEEEIAYALASRGWKVIHQVGVSGYRIDLGVVDPDRPGRYLAGVECDGATYHRAKSARDRDKLRQGVLEGLGWRIFRIWSTDWWLDPVGALDKMDARLKSALEEDRVLFAAQQAREEEEARRRAELETSLPMEVAQEPAPATAYPGLDPARFEETSYRPLMRAFVASIVERHSPIYQDVLIRKVCEAHGRRATSRAVDVVEKVVEKRFGRSMDDGRLVRWVNREAISPVVQWREIDRELGYSDVPLCSLAGLASLHDQDDLPDAMVIRGMASAFGLSRVKAQAEERLSKALALMRKQRRRQAVTTIPAVEDVEERREEDAGDDRNAAASHTVTSDAAAASVEMHSRSLSEQAARMTMGPVVASSPNGNLIVLPESDNRETGWLQGTEDFAVEVEAYLTYVDGKGQESKREIRTRSLCRQGEDGYALLAFCHVRKSHRSFFVSRIQEFVDLSTGEVVQDVVAYLKAVHEGSPRVVVAREMERWAAEIVILVYIARADGRMTPRETEVILNYVLSFKPDLDTKIAIALCKDLMPSESDLHRAVEEIRVRSLEARSAFMEALDAMDKARPRADELTVAAFEHVRDEIS